MLASLGRGTGSRSGIGCMKIAILKERRAHETRVAGSPDTVKRFVDMGVEVAVEKGAGDGASIHDQAFKAAGAGIAGTAAPAPKGADQVIKVPRPIGSASRRERVCRFV